VPTFTTGIIDNTPVGGVRPVSTIQIRFAIAKGADTINIRGFFRADNGQTAVHFGDVPH
jgi:hypothetical protein